MNDELNVVVVRCPECGHDRSSHDRTGKGYSCRGRPECRCRVTRADIEVVPTVVINDSRSEGKR